MIRPIVLLAMLLAFPVDVESPPAGPSFGLVVLDEVWPLHAVRESPRKLVTSLCGEPTRTTGKPCRNKVRGGGACWRHR